MDADRDRPVRRRRRAAAAAAGTPGRVRLGAAGTPGRVRLGAAAGAAVALTAVIAGCTANGREPHTPAGSAGQPTTGATSRSAGTAGPTARSQDPARHAPSVIRYAGQAGVNPQLLMAILYNESYKPHDPAVERAWQRIKPDAAFGIANMHRTTFDETKRGREFAGRDWQELPDDPDLAIQAAAWYLHDLAAELPARWSGPYTRDELLALGYNGGAGSMAAFARGASPGEVSRSYLDRLRANWPAAGTAIRPTR